MKRRKGGAPAVAGLLALIIGLAGPAVARDGVADTRRAEPADELDDVLEAVGDVIETLFDDGVEELVQTLDATVAALDRPQFALPINVSVGTTPAAVALGDFNADNLPDLAVADAGAPTVHVVTNSTTPGAVVFSAGTITSVGVGAGQFDVAVGDFNADNRPDLAVARGTTPAVSVVMNGTPPGGSFTPLGTTPLGPVGSTSQAVAVGDFDGNGKPDLAAADSTGKVHVVPNDTPANSATFMMGPAPLTTLSVPVGGMGAAPQDVAVGDFDEDGRPDLVVANDAGNVAVLLNTSTAAALAFTVTAMAIGDTPISVAVGDLNDDEDLDIAVAKFTADEVAVLLGNGDGTFDLPQAFPVGNPLPVVGTVDTPVSVGVGDFNGGGKLDVVTANSSADNVSVLLGNGRGGLGAPTNFDVQTRPFSVAVGDLNLDAKLDLAVANSGATSVSVLINTAAVTP